MLTIQQYSDSDFSLDSVKLLYRAYESFLNIPLDFQNFEAELANLPGKYAPPSGNLYLALWDNRPVGCAAFYQMSEDICELKRVFVLPEYQGKQIGKQVIERAIQDATMAGYQTMRLDSLRRLESAFTLYQKFGFQETAPYNQNPLDDVYYMEKALIKELGYIT